MPEKMLLPHDVEPKVKAVFDTLDFQMNERKGARNPYRVWAMLKDPELIRHFGGYSAVDDIPKEIDITIRTDAPNAKAAMLEGQRRIEEALRRYYKSFVVRVSPKHSLYAEAN